MRELTEEEHEVLDLLGEALIKFSELPPVYPYDCKEFMALSVAAQNIVLARPATETVIDGFVNKTLEDANA